MENRRHVVAGLGWASRSYDQASPDRVRSNPSTEPIMKPDRTQPQTAFRVASLLALIVAGHTGAAIAQAPQKVPSGDPCTVVPLFDVKKAFPGAKAGVRSTRIEKYGITECTWKDGGGVDVLMIQESYGTDAVMDEAKTNASGLIDPTKPADMRNVRFEVLTSLGLGNQAVAFVEAPDAKRGIVRGLSVLVLQRGPLSLHERDRAAALKTIEAWGRIAAKRLD
jgi:hypothetical protein